MIWRENVLSCEHGIRLIPGGAVTYKMDTYVRLRPRNPGAFGERKTLKMRGL